MAYLLDKNLFCQCGKLRSGGKYCTDCQIKAESEYQRKWREKRKQVLSKWDIIKQKVFKRDEYSCKICKEKNRLLVHHKDESGTNSFSNDKTEVNNKMSNLITLCFRCHSDLHTKLRRKSTRVYY